MSLIENVLSLTSSENSAPFAWVHLEPVPPPQKVLSHRQDIKYAFLYPLSDESLSISTISASLYPSYRDGTWKLDQSNIAHVFNLCCSTLDKYWLLQLLLAKYARGPLLTKISMVRYLKLYTHREKVKGGVISEAIDAIVVGKISESPTSLFFKQIINVLNLYHLEMMLSAGEDFKRVLRLKELLNGQVTLKNSSVVLDSLQRKHKGTTKTKDVFPQIEKLFDMLAIFNPRIAKTPEFVPEEEADDANRSVELILRCCFRQQSVKESSILDGLCDTTLRGFPSAIFNARSSLWDAVYSIDFLKMKNLTGWHSIRKFMESNERRSFSTSVSHRLVIPIQVGTPFKIMRCVEGKDLSRVANKLSEASPTDNEPQGFCVEDKLDGERSCIHLWRDSNNASFIHMVFYSRNMIRQTWYGSYVGDPSGTITKYMKNEFFEGIQNMILDGEMVTFDEEKQNLLGFSSVKKCGECNMEELRKGVDLRKAKLYNKFLCFDILYLNNESLQLTTLRERKNKLQVSLQNFGFEECKFFELHNYNVGYNVEDLQIALDNVRARNGEGLVMKKWDSLYFVGTNSPYWLKIKPHHIENFVEDLDVLIIGMEGKGNYICALYGGDDDSDSEYYKTFVSFTLLVYGITREARDYISEKTSGCWKPYSKYSMAEIEEQNVKFGKMKPLQWINPQDSVVITVKSSSLNFSEDVQRKFVLSSTLGHPYFMSVRYDKMYYECDTVGAYQERVDTIRKRKLNYNADRKPKLRRKADTKKAIELKDINRNIIRTIAQIDDLFQGITFCVISDCLINGKWVDMSEVNGILESHGGKLISNPHRYQGDKLLVICERKTSNAVIYSNDYEIFKFKWCLDSIRSKRLVRFDPSHCFIVSNAVREICERNINKLGINYSVDYDIGLFQLAQQKIEDGVLVEQPLAANYIDQLGYTFYNERVKFQGFSEITSFQLQIAQVELEICGGTVVSNLDDATVLVVPEKQDLSTVESISEGRPVYTWQEFLNMCRDRERGNSV